jgi:hypothetical protein
MQEWIKFPGREIPKTDVLVRYRDACLAKYLYAVCCYNEFLTEEEKTHNRWELSWSGQAIADNYPIKVTHWMPIPSGVSFHDYKTDPPNDTQAKLVAVASTSSVFYLVGRYRTRWAFGQQVSFWIEDFTEDYIEDGSESFKIIGWKDIPVLEE